MNVKFLKNSQIIILGICIAAATIVSSFVISQGLLKITKFKEEQITVTGAAQKDIKSDFITWSCSFSARSTTLEGAYKKITQDLPTVKQYLLSKDIKEDELSVSSIITTTLFKKNEKGYDTNDIQGYLLMQYIEVKSYDVDRVAEISKKSTELINNSIEYVSYAPQFIYTKLDTLKVEMLAEASNNAKQRAQSMLNSTGNQIGFMKSAKMGVFQITPITSTDISDYGINDTTSLYKKVTAVVSASFSIK